VSSFLFHRNLKRIVDKGINITDLLDSKVFSLEFDYDLWPGSHPNNEEMLMPYNGSIFSLRSMYDTVFPDKEMQYDEDDENTQKLELSKIYKIKYSLNLLPQIGAYIDAEIGEYENEDLGLTSIFSESDHIEVFTSKTLQ